MTEAGTTSSNGDRWDRWLRFQESPRAFALFGVALAVAVLWDDTWWSVPFKVIVLVLGVSYWTAIIVKSVQNFRSGYQGSS